MLTISGCRVTAQLYENNNYSIYRGYRLADQQPVILKMLKEPYPAPELQEAFKREYEIIRRLNFEGVVKAYSLETGKQQRLIMVLEDFGGKSLASLKLAGQLSLQEFLKLGISITEILDQLHYNKVIHQDINPYNIIYNPNTKQIKIIDFSLAIVQEQKFYKIEEKKILQGTIAYMSPEQTGRINRLIDWRTDFYSLGVTFYELLTGKLPFESHDPLELIHFHIAKEPISPHQIKPEIPEVISRIVMKMLAKDPENRYQSAWGIKSDLVICLMQLEAGGLIQDIIPGQNDILDRFKLPQKIYGRNQELQNLITDLKEYLGQKNRILPMPNNPKKIILVTGDAGIGKSAFVEELSKPIAEKRGYFISGKCQPDVPYSAFIAAFQKWIKQLLSESETKLNQWRKKLHLALSKNVQEIIALIPDLQFLIEQYEDKFELEIPEITGSVHRGFLNLLRVFCTGEYPLAIFIDDLQWADPGTLELLQWTIADSETYQLLTIGAYRDNEVSASDPLAIALKQIQKKGVKIDQIYLSPLSIDDTIQLIEDTFQTDGKAAKALAELVLQKTNGNPFFIKEFLTNAYETNSINFDREYLTWEWDLSAITQMEITENVVNILADKIIALPEITQNILQVAACIGMTFEISTLATLTESTPSEVFAHLSPAIKQKLVVALNCDHLLKENSESEAIAQYRFKFQHKKLQVIAEFMTNSQFRNLTKLQIGRLLLQQPRTTKENLFELVNYYNRGIPSIIVQSEKIQLAELNLLAAQKAKQQNQYRTVLNYLQIARKLLNSNSWQSHDSLSQTIYLELIEAYYLQQKFEQAENLVNLVLQPAKENIQYVRFYELKIKIDIARQQMKLALETGRYVLEQILGVSLVTSLSFKPILLELENLPEITDPDKQAALRILTILYTPAMAIAPELLSSVAQTMMNLCMEYGNSPEAAFAYVLYGVTLCEKMIDIDLGYQFGQLSLKILDKFPNSQIASLVFRLFNTQILIFKEPAQSLLDEFKQVSNYSQNFDLYIDDLARTAYDRLTDCSLQFLLGKLNLPIAQNFNWENNLVSETFYTKYWESIWQAIANKLLNKVENDFSEQEMIKFWTQAEYLPESQKTYLHHVGLFNFHLSQSILAYFIKDYPGAVNHASLAEKYQQAGGTVLAITAHKFYFCLSLLALEYNQKKSEETTTKVLQKTIKNQQILKKWAEQAPRIFLHKYQLLEAEKARFLGEYWQAGLLYDQAIYQAKQNNYIHELALAYELAAEFYVSQNLQDIAKNYLSQAHETYMQWQAWAKVKDLESRYSDLFSDLGNSKNLTIPGASTTEEISHNLDLNSILKAAQTLSSEIVLDTLLEKMMQVVLENAGAQKGYLLIPKDEQWVIQAFGIIDSNESSAIEIQQSIPIETDEESQADPSLCYAIANYVIRTQENLVLNDALHEGDFTHDRYILQQQPKSILCAPLIHQGKLAGILYLENNLATGAFTPDRLEILKLLSSQAAIALENAHLYAQLEESNRNLEEKVKQRTAELAEATQRAQTASQAKSIFLANMSHELRTPLNAILGFTQVITRSQNIPSEHQENLSIILRSGEHLLNLINQVLDLSKIEAGQPIVKPTNFDLYSLLDDLKDMFDLKADNKRLQLIFERFPEVPQYIRTDEIKLRQVLINLLNNAIKFTEEGGVSLRVSVLTRDEPDISSPDLSLSVKSQEILFEVEDSGPGIAADELDTLFQAFTQTKTGQQSQEGTGLGLAISSSFVQLMGGEITVESEVGIGTIFRLNIQVDVVDTDDIESSQAKRRIIALEPNQPRYRILIVDDRQDNRQLLIKLLNPLGFELEAASNGQEAIDLWETFSPHLIWMDLRMPVMNGYQATKQIKATPKGRDTVIIALTASILEEERAAVFSAGCDDLMYKPFRQQTIFQKMTQYLGVRYIYEETSQYKASNDGSTPKTQTATLNQDILSLMPLEWVLNLHQASLEADSDLVDQLIQEIPESQASLAQAIEGVVNKFQFEKIIEFTELIIDETCSR